MGGGEGMETPIIHVDMDAFFASVEVRENPQYRGKPVIIGGDPRRDVRSVVSTASYEARKFGVHSAMPLMQAYRLCPQGIFLRGNMSLYGEVSKEIMAIFARYTPLVEPLSVDEAFLDVSGCQWLFGPPEEIAASIQKDIEEELELTASVGIAPNKFLAKLASDLKKPRGFTVIRPGEIEEVLNPLPVEKLWGVGEKTALKLRSMGIDTVGQLASLPEKLLTAAFGKSGRALWYLARGEDFRAVEVSRAAKSVSRETTFSRDVTDMDKLYAVILELAEDVATTLRASGFLAEKVTLKLRYGNFETITRQGPLPAPACLTMPIYHKILELLAKVDTRGRGIRLVGVGTSNLINNRGNRQLSFFESPGLDREEKIAEAVDKVSARYGIGAIKRAALLKKDRPGKG
jgi:DNA polymerase-4